MNRGVLCATAMLALADTVFASPQIVLDATSVIGGSGSWDVLPFNAVTYGAHHVVDNQSGTISESDAGSFWLGREDTAMYSPYGNEFFVLDLGTAYLIDRIDLFNTHNQLFNDRGTKDFIVYAANAVTPAGGTAGYALSEQTQILAGSLVFQAVANDPIEAETFTADSGLATGTAYRYLMFKAVNTFTPTGHNGYRSVGLNEIRVYGSTPANLSSNATLSALSLSAGTLIPAFEPNTTNYTVSVSNNTVSVTLTATAADASASITVNGAPAVSGTAGDSISLNAGQNAITVVVAAENGGTQTYLITVTRQPLEQDLYAAFTTPTDVPFTSDGFSAGGLSIHFSLGFAPAPGTSFTAIRNTGPAFITGTFANVAQGQAVNLEHNGTVYPFVANYYGGDGNDLVLVWARQKYFVWGMNDYGQLGDGTNQNSNIPVDISTRGALAGKTIVAAAVGQRHALALASDGTLVAWGANYSGQLGDGTTTDSPLPVDISASGVLAGRRVVSVAAGLSHSLAVCSDGTVAAWGWNSNGQIGNLSYDTRVCTPIRVNDFGSLTGKTATGVAAGKYHSLARCSDGQLAAWGSDHCGQLGPGYITPGNCYVPILVSQSGALAPGKIVSAIAAGGFHSLALCADGTVAAWGSNEYGQLGNNSTVNSGTPVRAAGFLSAKFVVELVAGFDHTLARCSDGSLSAWGCNYFGTLGNGNATDLNYPIDVSGRGILSSNRLVALGTGQDSSFAILGNGTFAAWGRNNVGQLGNGSNTDCATPGAAVVPWLPSGASVAQLAIGPAACHSFAVAGLPLSAAGFDYRESGEVLEVTAGYGSGALTIPGSVDGKPVTSIAAGAFLDCDLTRITIPANVVSIGAQAFQGCAHLKWIFFAGHAPDLGADAFAGADQATLLYCPGTSGWGATFGGRPALLWNPQICADAGFAEDRFGFTILGTAGIPVFIESCLNLSTGTWNQVGTGTLGSSGALPFSDPASPGRAAAFYRIVWP